MTSILVTGGAGFIGSHLVELLVKEGFNVTVLDNLVTGDPENLARVWRSIKFIQGDFTRWSVLERALQGVEVVVHEAAIVGVESCDRYPDLARVVNVRGIWRLLEVCRKKNVKRVVYASSAAVYGEPEKLPVSEDSRPHPMSLYARTKLEGENLFQKYCGKVEWICLRYFNVYGPGQNPAYAGVITKFLQCVREKVKPVIYGDGQQTRDFIHVKDVARATRLAIEKDCAGEVINIGTGRAFSVLQLLQLISELSGVKLRPKHLPPRPGDVRRSQAEVSKAERLLSFKAQIDLDKGLKEMLRAGKV